MNTGDASKAERLRSSLCMLALCSDDGPTAHLQTHCTEKALHNNNALQKKKAGSNSVCCCCAVVLDQHCLGL